MKKIIFLCSLLPLIIAGKSISPEIVKVISVDSWKDTKFVPNINPQYRFRAILYKSLYSEEQSRLVIEKIYHGGAAGTPHKVIFSKDIDIRVSNRLRDQDKKLSFESQIGCCEIRNIKWEGFKLIYTIETKPTASCEIENVNKSLVPICKPK